MADFKNLHDEWKKAKKDAKLIYDGWARFFGDVIAIVDTGKDDLAPFPGFSKGLGPSLDNIHKALDNIKKAEGKKKPADKKDTDAVAKNKKKAEEALKQYKEDIAKLANYVTSKPVPGEGKQATSDKQAKALEETVKKGKLYKSTLAKELVELDGVRKKIKTALEVDLKGFK